MRKFFCIVMSVLMVVSLFGGLRDRCWQDREKLRLCRSLALNGLIRLAGGCGGSRIAD